MTRGTALALTCIVAWACAPDCEPAGSPARQNVVLITVDTLRADYLGAYGSSTVRTPALDRLAAEGTVFESCYAQTNVTVPSHLTIFTSLPLPDHGVLGNGRPLPRSVVTLPQVFAEAGYRTAAVVSANHLGPEFAVGHALGTLDHYEAPRRLSEPASAAETNRHLFGWIRSACKQPFYVWVHYWDPHMPYAPPPPFDGQYYDDDPYDARHTSMEAAIQPWHHYERRPLRPLLAAHRDELRRLQDELKVSWATLRTLILERGDLSQFADDPRAAARLRARLDRLAEELRANLPLQPGLAAWLTNVRDLRFPRARYAGEVSYVDAAIGELRAELERLAIADHTIILVTGDHGESLGEHGIYFGHAGLYEASLRVPLVVWGPGRVAQGRRGELVSSLDVAPTLLGLAGLPVPPTMQGRDLLADSLPEIEIVSVANHGRQIMLRDGRWKLIRTLEGFYYVDAFAPRAGDRELYDLWADPAERVNLVSGEPETTARLDAKVDAWLAVRSTNGSRQDRLRGTAVGLSREQQEGLRALGYVE
jgi:arylsulfatase A-like enzyme